MKAAALAFLLSSIGTVALVMHECSTGTHDACLVSKGMWWLVLPVLFLFFWGCIAAIRAFVKEISASDKD
jgi:hypothetical protein